MKIEKKTRMARLNVLLLVGMFQLVIVIGSPSALAGIEHPSAKISDTNLNYDFESLRTRYWFQNDGTGYKEVTVRLQILNESGTKQWARLVFDYKPFYERLEIPYVRLLKKRGDLIQLVTDEVKQTVTSEDKKDFYDEETIDVKTLSPGDFIEYDVRTVFLVPLAKGQFWMHYKFQNIGVSDEQLEINVPDRRVVKTKAAPNVHGWVNRKAERRIYHWSKISSQQRFLDDSRYPDVQLTSFTSWEDVGHWYEELERPHRRISPEVQAKADELTKDMSSNFAKAEALYNFVAKKIKYLSLASLGIGGYEPVSAAETMRNEYGDCKAKSVLLEALLDAEGMQASSVLIGNGRTIDLNVPTPWAFNHAITLLRLGKEQIWLDSSLSTTPFGMLSKPLRGEHALVISSDRAPYLDVIPRNALIPENLDEEIIAALNEEGKLEATVRISVRGDISLPLRQMFLDPIESVRPIVVQGLLKRPDDRVTNVQISDPTDTREPFVLTFQILIRDVIDLKGRSALSLPLSDFGFLSYETPENVDWRGIHIYKIDLTFPQDLSFEAPTSFAISEGSFSYRADYILKQDHFVVERTLVSKSDESSETSVTGRIFCHKAMEDLQRRIPIGFSKSLH